LDRTWILLLSKYSTKGAAWKKIRTAVVASAVFKTKPTVTDVDASDVIAGALGVVQEEGDTVGELGGEKAGNSEDAAEGTEGGGGKGKGEVEGRGQGARGGRK
jgi:hypothetical protein